METFDMIQLGGFITICASATALVIKQIESSKCENIECCGIKCKRKVVNSVLDEEQNNP